MILEIVKAPNTAPSPNTIKTPILSKILCKALSKNSYNPKISKIKAPEIPGKNIALIAKKPPRKMYPKPGLIFTGITNAKKIPNNSPKNPNNLFLVWCFSILSYMLLEEAKINPIKKDIVYVK